jgi:hypothetical protein
MKSAVFSVLVLLLLGTTILQTLRVNHWKHVSESKTAECNRVVAANEKSFQQSSADERAIELKVQNHLTLVYKLQEQRLANRRSIISVANEIQLVKSILIEMQGVRDEIQQLLNSTYTVTHLSTANH